MTGDHASTPEALWRALVELRQSSDPKASRHDGAWRAVDAFLRATFPQRGPEADDARQETLVSIAHAVTTMEATVPLQAAKWVSVIHRRKNIDAIRVKKRDPVERGLARASDEESGSPIDRLESADERAVARDAIERIVRTVEDHLDALLVGQEPSASVRQLRRLQVRATLHRLVLDAEFEELRAVLDLAEDSTRDKVYKWVERGRPWVLAALDRWSTEEGPEGHASAVIAVVREAVEKRRADAGRPRTRKEGPA